MERQLLSARKLLMEDRRGRRSEEKDITSTPLSK
jgi:hypothetical protein